MPPRLFHGGRLEQLNLVQAIDVLVNALLSQSLQNPDRSFGNDHISQAAIELMLAYLLFKMWGVQQFYGGSTQCLLSEKDVHYKMALRCGGVFDADVMFDYAQT